MEREEALALLHRITTNWGQRLATSVHDHWMNTLTDLEPGPAGTAYARLQGLPKMPSPAEFRATVSTLATRDQSTGYQCTTCGYDANGRWTNTGLITDTDHPHHWPGRPGTMPPETVIDNGNGTITRLCNCNCVTWCPNCDAGRTMRDTLRRNHPATTTAPDDRNHRAA